MSSLRCNGRARSSKQRMATSSSPWPLALPFPDLYRGIGKRKRETMLSRGPLFAPMNFPSIILLTGTSIIVTMLNHIRRLQPEHILEVLRKTPLRVAPGTTQATSAHLNLLLHPLILVRQHRRDSDQHLERWFKQLQPTS